MFIYSDLIARNKTNLNVASQETIPLVKFVENLSKPNRESFTNKHSLEVRSGGRT
jgi:hypothetical protein